MSEEVLQKVKELAEDIGNQGMSALFVVDHDNAENTSVALNIAENVSPTFALTLLAARAEGNFDTLVSLFRESGFEHNSVVLNLLGFPPNENIREITNRVIREDRLVLEIKALISMAQRMGFHSSVSMLLKILTDKTYENFV